MKKIWIILGSIALICTGCVTVDSSTQPETSSGFKTEKQKKEEKKQKDESEKERKVEELKEIEAAKIEAEEKVRDEFEIKHPEVNEIAPKPIVERKY